MSFENIRKLPIETASLVLGSRRLLTKEGSVCTLCHRTKAVNIDRRRGMSSRGSSLEHTLPAMSKRITRRKVTKTPAEVTLVQTRRVSLAKTELHPGIRESGAPRFHSRGTPTSGSGAGEDALPDGGVDAPVAVDNLGDAEVDGDRHQGDCLVLAQPLRRHEKVTHLPEGISHREVD